MNKSCKNANNNPFRVSQMESLPWVNFSLSIDKLFENWQQNNFYGQLIGKHGAGKTTASLLLQQKAIENGFTCHYLFANTDSKSVIYKDWLRQISLFDVSDLLILDGIDHAPFFLKRKLFKAFRQTLFIVHQPIKNLPIIDHFHVTPELLIQLVENLAGEEGLVLLEKAGGAKKLLEKHRDNLRECFFELFKFWYD